jgi:oxygen-independent coproporphyrinogen-3 oxidase
MQSASEDDLKILGRSHSFKDVENSVGNARKAGFLNINLDLIFGIPHQTLKSFKNTLKAALDLSPNHLSLYALSVEDSTPLAAQIAKGDLPEPDDDIAADMYTYAMEALEGNGFTQYEISNWAKGEKSQCLHNLQYWRNLDYLGFGAGAHSLYKQSRWENRKTITEYIDSVSKVTQNGERNSAAGINYISLSEKDELSETMMMGMRLTQEGINSKNFVKRFGTNLEDVYSKEIKNLLNRELVEWIEIDNQRLFRMTKKGRLLGNQVFMEFISD